MLKVQAVNDLNNIIKHQTMSQLSEKAHSAQLASPSYWFCMAGEVFPCLVSQSCFPALFSPVFGQPSGDLSNFPDMVQRRAISGGTDSLESARAFPRTGKRGTPIPPRLWFAFIQILVSS
jgi:hypothetical protein